MRVRRKVAANRAYQNAMKNSDKAAARLEHDVALKKVVIGMMADHMELFRHFQDNPIMERLLLPSRPFPFSLGARDTPLIAIK